MTNWYKAQSMTKPEEYDTTSSPTTVYQRKEIAEVQIAADHENKETVTGWEYMERQLTREEYNAFQAELESPATQMIMQTLSAIELAQEMLMM